MGREEKCGPALWLVSVARMLWGGDTVPCCRGVSVRGHGGCLVLLLSGMAESCCRGDSEGSVARQYPDVGGILRGATEVRVSLPRSSGA